ncbi:membrane-bound alkaline phosphatase-like [Anoplophora glabripennis]|uniref:membrane-bound alkaline phosphatase-like n=1 Tax=Anoplophora glabripennis TaxID=217634 RepID=UPI000C7617A7|nr:membrane-bound alkaline phosphatase-like [Anoplophora glabripennis]
MHPPLPKRIKYRMTDVESTGSYWHEKAQAVLKQKLKIRHNENVAKNVIMFIGDGMSIPTLTATRMYMGDEENELSFERFHHTALSKTYCVDAQTADSACSATAYLGGVKANIATIGVTAAVELNDCDEMVKKENHVHSIASWSQDVGKRTGIVTTSTVTDASPSGAYAHIANRLWQNDATVTEAGWNATKCRDIAYQLIKGKTGSKFNFILGGGSQMFLPIGHEDEAGSRGTRSDGRNLIEEWLKDKKNKEARYVWNRDQLLDVPEDVEYVFGLFSEGYMPYNLDRNTSSTPSLAEMTEAAIKVVSRGNGAKKGFFLFIEGGRIDHGHHAALAQKALDETVELSKAIEKALEMTNEDDTLIVVTADHAHTLSMSGYPERNNGIFDIAGTDTNGYGYLTLNYANGPGYKPNGHRVDSDDTNDKDYQFPGIYNLTSETHGADDVGIFANGPWAHLYSGVIEENTIPHIMAYASCVGPGLTACSKGNNVKSNEI